MIKKWISTVLLIMLCSPSITIAATLYGQVFDAGTENGVEGAIVTIGTGASATTNSEGSYEIHGLNRLRSSITVSHPDYLDFTQGFFMKNSDRECNFYLSKTNYFFVSPTGNDANPGSRTEPFATLETARERAREAVIEERHKKAIVFLRYGKYIRDASFKLDETDSNTEYHAYPGENYTGHVRIIGGVQLIWKHFNPVPSGTSAWQRLPETVRGKVYQINLFDYGIRPEDLGKLKPRGFDSYWPGGKIDPSQGIFYPDSGGPLEIFIDQEPMQIARWPDKDPKKHTDLAQTPQSGTEQGITISVEDPENSGQYPTDRWTHAPDPWVQGFWYTDYEDRQTSGTIDDDNHTILLNGLDGETDKFTIGGRFYYVKNLLEEITQPGEYYLDRVPDTGTTGTLYIYPPDNNINMRRKEVMVSTLGDSLLILEGTTNVKFKNIIFEMGRGELVTVHPKYSPVNPNDLNDPVNFTHATHNRFEGCVFRNAYYGGITIIGNENKIERCKIYNTGDWGAYLGTGNFDDDQANLKGGGNEIHNSIISKVSRWRMGFCPGIRLKGVGQKITDNDLSDMPAAAIFGAHHQKTLIQNNKIWNVLQYGRDIAAIYLPFGWHNRGSVIRNNYIHDIPANRWPAYREPRFDAVESHWLYGIYIDDCLSGATIEQNIFSNLVGAAIYHGGGRDNHMEKNIMINCGAAFWTDNRGMARIQSPAHHHKYDLLDKLKAAEGGTFVHRDPDSPWYEFEGLGFYTDDENFEGFPTDWPTIRDGNWRQPEKCTFENNVGYNDDEWQNQNSPIIYFAYEEEKNALDETYPVGWEPRGKTYPLNFFKDVNLGQDNTLETAEMVRSQFVDDINNFVHGDIDLGENTTIISITTPDGSTFEIPFDEIGADW
jgi:hypothetical protein